MEVEVKAPEIDHDLEKKIKKTVRRILQRSSLYQMSEKKARDEASAKLNLDLSDDSYKLIVREAVASFIEETIRNVHEVKAQRQKPEGERDVEGEGKKKKKKSKKKQSSD